MEAMTGTDADEAGLGALILRVPTPILLAALAAAPLPGLSSAERRRRRSHVGWPNLRLGEARLEPTVRGDSDPDLLVLEAMLAPPPLEEARRSLEYWQRRRQALPVYRRAARREAREMAARWAERVTAAERVRFEASIPGRVLRALGLSQLVVRRPTKGRVLALAWMLVPRRLKLVAAGLVAAWLTIVTATLIVGAALFDHLA